MQYHTRRNIHSIVVFFLCIVVTAVAYKNYSTTSYSVVKALDFYGFTSSAQKSAFENLLQKASVIPHGTSLSNAFPVRHSKEKLAQDLLKIVVDTQRTFVVRTGTQDRWEVQALDWMQQNKDGVLRNLDTLEFMNTIAPSIKNPDALCILGSTRKGMAKRIEHANSLIEAGLKPKTIVLLAGERYVTKDIDGTEQELSDIAHKLKLNDWKKLTETHLICDLFQESPLSRTGIDHHVIDTPAGDLPRPTTQTVMLELISWLRQHPEIKTLVFVSNQPYVRYQNAIICSIFKKQNINLRFETVGAAADNVTAVKPLIEGLGTFLWAATPLVLSQSGISLKETQDPELKQVQTQLKKTCTELYAKNPLIYQGLPSSFHQ